jgi:hypothetical protein
VSGLHVGYTGSVRDVANASIVEEPPKLAKQALNLLVGRCLGQGAYRRVYELRHAPDLVIKLEYSHDLANAAEWMAWRELSGTEWGKWLAPCVSIDEFTGALVQKRARDLTDAEWAALREYPAFLGDAGRRNWGWYEGRPVMRDYAFNHLASRGLNRMRMVGLQHAVEEGA